MRHAYASALPYWIATAAGEAPMKTDICKRLGIDVPVFACPTSVGYGVSLGGVSAMLTMLNSCAPGVSVLNVDNGFGAAACAFKVVKRRKR